VVEYSKGKITVLNKREINSQEEIMEDLMQIMNVYVAKINGSRKYSKNIKKNV
jgi:predicted site-specific integrase-resolvase